MRLLGGLGILALSSGAFAQGSASDLYGVRIRKLKEGVYLAYRPEPLRYFVEGNVTIIVNEHDVVVVDGGGAPAAARNVIAEIGKLTSKPVRYLINTHDHVDHTLGNQEYVKAYPGVEIVSHPAARERLLSDGVAYVSETASGLEASLKKGVDLIDRLRKEGAPGNDRIIAYWERYKDRDIYERLREYREATITPPTMTIEKRLVLHRGSRTIEILHLGHGDTPGDLVVYLLPEKIACTGDMLTHPVPYGFSSEPLAWLETLRRLHALDVEYLIPGHGEVQHGKGHLDRVMRLLQTVQDQVRGAIADGLDLEGTRKRVDLSRLIEEFAQGDPVIRYRFRGWFIEPNVEETFRVLKDKR